MRRALIFAGAVLAGAGAAMAWSAELQAGRKAARRNETKDLVVTLVTPTNNQEVLPDLSDPGLNNVITVRFSSSPRGRDVIDNQNVFNRLTSKVEFLDTAFARLPGTPRLRRNVLVFDPRTPANLGVLPQGQYTLNLKSTIRNRAGRLLNSGVRDFTTTFSVGTDVYSPVLRRISPIDGQREIGLNQRVVATYTEPLSGASVVTTVSVQDASTNPPSPIPGAGGGTGVTLERNGFDLVFTPDPCFGYPARTNIQVLIQGDNLVQNTSPVTDVFGNPFRRDPGLQWSPTAQAGVFRSPNGTYDENTGVFKMQFVSKGVKPQPQGLVPGSPMFTPTPTSSPCAALVFFAPSCYATGRVLIYSNTNGLGEISLVDFINRFNQGVTDLSLVSQLANSPVNLGRPGGLVIDPRWDANQNLHTFIYMVNQRTATVDVIDSRNLKVLGRFTGFSSPRDVTIATDFSRSRTTLYVTDFASNQMVGIDLNGIAVNFGGQPGAPSPCENIKDQQDRRVNINTGRGPTGIAADSFLLRRVMTCNTLDNSVTLANVQTGQVIRDMDTGSTPVACDFSLVNFGAIDLALIANQGGLNDPDGSVSMYIRSAPIIGSGFFTPNFAGAAQTRDGIEATFTEGIKNPTEMWGSQQWPTSVEWWVPNTGGRTVSNLTINTSGVFAVNVTPSIVAEYDVGLNPTSVVFDPFYPQAFVFAAVASTGTVAGFEDLRQGIPPTHVRIPGVRRLYTCFSH